MTNVGATCFGVMTSICSENYLGQINSLHVLYNVEVMTPKQVPHMYSLKEFYEGNFFQQSTHSTSMQEKVKKDTIGYSPLVKSDVNKKIRHLVDRVNWIGEHALPNLN